MTQWGSKYLGDASDIIGLNQKYPNSKGER